MVRSVFVLLTGASAGLALFAGACTTREDAMRGEAVERNDTASVAVTVQGWRLEHTTSVGGPGAPERELLFAVPAVAEGTRGDFYVLNSGNQSVLAFDSAGRHLRTIGQEGEGPGEFISPAAIVSTPGDTLFVLDAPASRISRFRISDGGFVDAVPLRDAPGVPMRMESGPGGSLLVEFSASGAPGRPPRPVVARVNPATGTIARLVELDTISQIQVISSMDGRRVTRFIRAPFAPNPSWSSDGRGGVLFGTGTEFAVYRATPSGVALAFRAKAARQPVTAQDRTAFLEGRPDLEQVARDIPFPSTKPFFTALRLDAEGFLWIRIASRPDRQTWEVRDPGGKKHGELTLPGHWRLVGLSRRAVYVIENDPTGVEVLHRYRIVR